VHQDAAHLAVMTDQQLQGQAALTLLDDMAAQANFAYTGQADPVTGEVQGGVEWVYDHMPGLASMDITPYGNTSGSSSDSADGRGVLRLPRLKRVGFLPTCSRFYISSTGM
jgi:hypothetical protein